VIVREEAGDREGAGFRELWIWRRGSARVFAEKDSTGFF
jgi:hypothetical protein